MKESDIRAAYVRIREIDNTIPDEVLDFMLKASVNLIKHHESLAKKAISRKPTLTPQQRRELVDCPHCLNSSGYRAFSGSGSQKCETCSATGKVTRAKYSKLFIL